MKLLTLELAKGRFLWAYGNIQLTQANSRVTDLREDSLSLETLNAITHAKNTNQLLVTETEIEEVCYVDPPIEVDLVEGLDNKGLKDILKLSASKLSNQLLKLRKVSKNYMADVLFLVEEERTHKNRKSVHEILEREFSVSKGLTKGLYSPFVSEVEDDLEDQEVVELHREGQRECLNPGG